MMVGTASTKPKVIYLMGSGRTGSTIVGVTLGNCDGIFFAGELASWLMLSGEPTHAGKSALEEKERDRTEFWRSVREELGDVEALVGSEAYESLERASSAFRIDKWPARRGLRKRHERFTEDLYRSIASRAGTEHIVDTSHLPMRARLLQRLNGIDLYLVFLVRNTESTVASHLHAKEVRGIRQGPRAMLMATARLWINYLLSAFIFLKQSPDRRLLVRYEDFIANPEGVLRDMLHAVESTAEIPDLAALSTGIPLKANRLIRSDTVSLFATPAGSHRSSRVLRLADRPWRMFFARLKPAAARSTAPAAGHAQAPDQPCAGPQ